MREVLPGARYVLRERHYPHSAPLRADGRGLVQVAAEAGTSRDGCRQPARAAVSRISAETDSHFAKPLTIFQDLMILNCRFARGEACRHCPEIEARRRHISPWR